MPAKEIKELRQSGRLVEALQMAKTEYEESPENIWTKRNLSWVYHEYLKVNATAESIEEFISWLKQLVELKLPEDEKMLFDSLSFQLGKLLFSLAKVKPIPVQKIHQVLEATQNFHFTKPSDGYSFLLKAFHKGLKDSGYYLEFIDWWGLENLSFQDYQKEKLPNGKEIMALAEQTYIAYAKHLLPKRDMHGNLFFNREKVEEFLPKLEVLAENHRTYQYPAYFQAKLLLASGDNENVLSALIPFARKKQNDFWVWDVLAEAVEAEPEKAFSCLCRSLACNSPEEMLVGVRQKMADALIHRKLFNEAKTEIESILKVKEANAHRIPNVITQWVSQSWYAEAQNLKSNKSFYKEHSQLSEEILFADTPEELVFVEFVNSDKSILNFIASEQQFGYFKYDRFIKKVLFGDVLSIRFSGGAKGGRYNVLTCKRTTDQAFKSQFQKETEGLVRIKGGSSFGFLEDAFIHPSLIKSYGLVDGQIFKGRKIKTYDSKKEKWGWKIF